MAETREKIPFNGEMMRWAREWRGRTLDEAAKRVNKTAADIEAWEKGDKSPTVNQARELADLYERPFLEFFWSERPPVQELELAPDYRLHVDAPSAAQNREIAFIQGWIETQRLNALDLFETLDEEIPTVPAAIRARIDERPEGVAARARAALNFPIETQFGLTSKQRDELPNIIRRKLEAHGILTVKATALAKHGARGLAIAANPLPVVAFSNEAAAGQAFTLCHELGHIALNQSAISGPSAHEGGRPEVRRVEEWCNGFAAAFLIPADALQRLSPKPDQPAPEMKESAIQAIANKFRVSGHAMAIRLMRLGYYAPDFYWKTLLPIYRAREANHKGGGRPKYYGSRYVSAHGEMYTRLVLNAWGGGHITNHNAGEFMDIKNLAHLSDIRDNFGK